MLAKALLSIIAIAGLSACTTSPSQEVSPYKAASELLINYDSLTGEEYIKYVYQSRTWQPAHMQENDPIALSHAYATPNNNALVKVIGVDYKESVSSLAAKLWLIDHAEHTLDLTYYIFKYDRAGEAILGALCNAVKRGVDVRIMVDSLGSINVAHLPTKALESCAQNAGYMIDLDGNVTPHKARVQFVIINALTSPKSWANRRSHDKLFIKDGHFLGKDVTITGGRNISLDYYGIDSDGQSNPKSFLDLEVVLRSKDRLNNKSTDISVGETSSLYYSALFSHVGNRRISPAENGQYKLWLDDAQDSYSKLRAVPDIKEAYDGMDEYLNNGLAESKVRLAHQMENFSSTNVVKNAQQTKAENANSIEGILKAAIEHIETSVDHDTESVLRIVSPYIFSPQYKNDKGEVIYDGALALKEFLDRFPNVRVEIVTNSILTSDNYFTQSVIDMDTAPRLLLSDELREIWITSLEKSELNPDYINSEEWLAAVNNPRIQIYQTGLNDSKIIGGDTDYGKLHAKYFFGEEYGFVGTSNFDYRSRLYNNEMGYYFYGAEVSHQLLENYHQLKDISLRWGSPEWLEMRTAVFYNKTEKTYTSKSQRMRFQVMRNSGLIWLF